MGISPPPLPFSAGCGCPLHHQALLVARGRTLSLQPRRPLLLLSSANSPSSRSPGTHTAPSALLSLQVNSHRHRHQYHFFSDNSQTQSSSPAVTSSRSLCPLGSAAGLSQGLLPWPLCFSFPPLIIHRGVGADRSRLCVFLSPSSFSLLSAQMWSSQPVPGWSDCHPPLLPTSGLWPHCPTGFMNTPHSLPPQGLCMRCVLWSVSFLFFLHQANAERSFRFSSNITFPRKFVLGQSLPLPF